MIHQSSALADEDLPKYGPIDLRDQNAVFLVLEELDSPLKPNVQFCQYFV